MNSLNEPRPTRSERSTILAGTQLNASVSGFGSVACTRPRGRCSRVRGHDVSDILDADIESGRIYVLQSMSTDPLIANIKDLHKIGFSTTSVEQRVKGASTSPTYLMAPVKIVADYRVYNLKASALENLLYRVFADVRLDLTQVDRKGQGYDPSEWLAVPRAVINQAVSMIMSGEIIDYVYDRSQQRLVERGG